MSCQSYYLYYVFCLPEKFYFHAFLRLNCIYKSILPYIFSLKFLRP